MQNQKSNTIDREISISRLVDAPVDLVWEVWTNPEHVKNWWGPNGYTNTITKMDVTPGGEWDLVMHKPDGTDNKFKCFFNEVIKHEKLIYENLSWPKFIATVEFESKGKKTFIQWKMLFESKELMIEVVKKIGIDEGLKQNMQKLENYFSNISNL